MGRNNVIISADQEQEEKCFVIKMVSDKTDHVTHKYIRPVSGIGDAVMLRPALVANIKKFPDDRHIIYSVYPYSELYKDIVGLEVIDTQGATLDNKLELIESELGEGDVYYNVYNSCAIYETENQPYKVVYDKYGKAEAIPSGRHIILSRQQIWCSVIGVDFDVNNYDVIFSEEELHKASYYKGYGRYMFLHMESADSWRSYQYRQMLVDYFAKKYDGYVFVLDQHFQYLGKCKNVVTFGTVPIRVMWAIIANATLMVGVDSAGVHLAGSAKVPTFGIFGSTDPKMRLLYDRVAWLEKFSRIRKCRQPCWYLPCKHLSCLKSVSPRRIYKSVKSQMGDCL